MSVTTHAIGAPLDRLDGPLKVRGAATYAFEWPLDNPAYLYPLQAEIAAGRITGVDTSAATAEPGVLAVLTHENAPKLAAGGDAEVAVLQSDEVAFRGQFVGGVIAETSEIARDAARLVRVDYEQRAHDVELRPDRDDVGKPLNAALFGAGGGELQDGSPADTALGDVDAALASAAVRLDATYTTPMHHHNPMEPHTAIASWSDDALTLYCSSQGVHTPRNLLALAFGLDPARVRVISPHVGGGFGSKVYPSTYLTLAAMAAQVVAGRPVKLALTRQQLFSLVGYRPPSIQRIQLGADGGGRLTAIAHDVVQQTAKIKGFAEQIAVCSRTMYAAANRRTTHRLAALDVPVPTIMRGPGETTGMFALESAMDEMALACGLDPVEFRIRNEPDVHPESGLPFSSRNLVACLREGAGRMYSFGAQFAEVRVHQDTGELRVPRLLGVFDAGRIINPKTARSQLLGGMTWGLSMALHEHSVIDPRFGHVVNHDFAEYHIAANADAGSIEVAWLDEEDPHVNPMGAKGLGEVCMVGTAAAIANAVYHATGVRVRDLPITLDKLL